MRACRGGRGGNEKSLGATRFLRSDRTDTTARDPSARLATREPGDLRRGSLEEEIVLDGNRSTL